MSQIKHDKQDEQEQEREREASAQHSRGADRRGEGGRTAGHLEDFSLETLRGTPEEIGAMCGSSTFEVCTAAVGCERAVAAPADSFRVTFQATLDSDATARFCGRRAPHAFRRRSVCRGLSRSVVDRMARVAVRVALTCVIVGRAGGVRHVSGAPKPTMVCRPRC